MKSKRLFVLVFFAIFIALLGEIQSRGEATEEKVQKFVEWAKERGVKADKVEPYVDAEHGGYGIRAKTIIRKGDEIMRIPEKSLVLSRNSLNQMVQAVNEKGERPWYPLGLTLHSIDLLSNGTNNDAHLLSYFILFHLYVGERLPLFPWTQLLPDEIHNTLHFNDVDLSQLIGSELYEKTNVLKKQSTEYWERVIKPETARLMIELGNRDPTQWEPYFTLERWIWAMSIVSSRSAMVPRRGLVIPIYSDLFNHKTQPRDYAPIKRVEENGDFLIISQRTYVPSSPIYLDYGAMPSSDLLLFYGIVEDQNRNEAVTFYFTLDSDDPLLPEKETLLSSLHYPKARYLALQHQPSDDVIFYSRLRVANRADFETIKSQPLLAAKQKISDQNERDTYAYIHLVADALLRRYPTEIGEDELGLKSEDLPLHGRYAITVRLREKKLLVHVIQYCSSIIAAKLYENKKKDDAPPAIASEAATVII